MVKNATSFTSNGLRDWLIQRVTSVIITAYIVCLIGFFISHPQLQFSDWQGFYAHLTMRLFTVLTLFSVLMHSWIGMWTVTTDYIKCTYIRVGIQVLIIITLIVCFVWGIEILWSNMQ